MPPAFSTLFGGDARSIPERAPSLPSPRTFRPVIGLIGCGNISATQLDAYRVDGWRVAALCDARREAAEARAREYCPNAAIHTDFRQLLEDSSIDVVDVALHPEHRPAVIEAALRAGKHVLSQKPFALDLATARRLTRVAKEERRHLAVNQNARWAPHVSYLHTLCRDGYLGRVRTVQIHLNWNHTWIRGMDFERIHHILLYDFAIHWLDMVRLFFGGQRCLETYATVRRAVETAVRSPLLGGVTLGFESGIASFLLDGADSPGPQESIVITGSEGSARATGPLHAADCIEVIKRDERVRPQLSGRWYREGFRGAMNELLCAIEEDRPAAHSAEDNLRTLEILFAVIDSADAGAARRPGEVDAVGDTCRIL